jgi:hypothetical protein
MELGRKGRKGGDGARNRIRTYDLRITNAPLYQLSYPGPEGLRILNASQPDEKFDAGVFGAGRRRGQLLETHGGVRQVGQGPGFEVLEVVVRLGVGVEPGAIAVDGELAHHAPGGEEVEGVVDGGLRHPRTLGAQALEDRLGGEVLGRAQQQRGDFKALRRRLDATAAQALGDGMQGGRNQHERDYRAIAGKYTGATDSAA